MERKKQFDTSKFAKDFLKKVDWRIRENANIPFSFSSMFFRGAGEVISRYLLNDVYSRRIARAHTEGDIHIHNLYMGTVGYCAGWSLRELLREGLGGVPYRLTSAPPQHLSTAVHQIINFIGVIQNEWAGAQAFNSFDTILAPFVRKDKLDYKEVRQAVQEFVFGINVTARWGGQSPFTNITLDWVVPEDLANEPILVGGELQKDTYSEYQEEADLINKAFCDVMLEGDAAGRPFTFPIPTYNLTKDFGWNSENSDLLFEMTSKYGTPYFQNFIKSDLDPREIRAMCCRLRLDLRSFYRRMGGYFGYANQTGSIGVVTVNLPRIGYYAKNEEDFFERLGQMMDLAKDSLEIKREVIRSNMDKGLLPFTKKYLKRLMWHFSTIGIVGMNEACLNFLDQDIGTQSGKDFAVKVLKFMRNRIIEYQKETENVYNLEATPAEGCSYRLARLDKKKYPDIITAGEKTPYYTNSSHLPVNYTDDLFSALKHQEDLQILYTGGTIFHAFIGEEVPQDFCRALIKKISHNFKIPYFTITPSFSVCPDHGYLSGELPKCPKCGRGTEVYSRVVGYLRPVSNWNKGKQEEFEQRKTYKVG